MAAYATPEATSTCSMPNADGERAPGELSDRHRDEGAERVVGVGAREHVRRRCSPASRGSSPCRRPRCRRRRRRPRRRARRAPASSAEHEHRQRQAAARPSMPEQQRPLEPDPQQDDRHERAGRPPRRRGRSPSPGGRSVSSATAGPRVSGAPAWIDVEEAEARARRPTATWSTGRTSSPHGARRSVSGGRRRAPCGGMRDRGEAAGQRASQVGGVDGQRPAGADGDHEQRADGRAEHGQPVAGERQQGVGRLQLVARDQLRAPRSPSPGSEMAETAPWTMLRATMSIQISALPGEDQRRRSSPGVTAEATLENWSTRVRGKRSEITPPQSSSSDHRDGVRREHLAEGRGGVGRCRARRRRARCWPSSCRTC